MKIYTKNGDKGETQLLGGTKVSKNNLRLKSYGSIDELNAYIGHIFDHDIDKRINQFTLSIQNKLFKFPDDYIVYAGHMGDTTIGAERLTNPIRQYPTSEPK